MKKFLILLLFAAPAWASSQSSVRSSYLPPSQNWVQARGGGDCQKDSTLIFDYLMPVSTDKIEERVLYTYGNGFEVSRRFRRNSGGSLARFSIDSTVFNTVHQPTFRETRGADLLPDTSVSNQIFYFPCPGTGTCEADSTIVFNRAFPGSPLSPFSKTVNIYDNLGRLQRVVTSTGNNDFTGFNLSEREDYEYSVASGRLMSIFRYAWTGSNGWVPAIRQNYNYTPSGQLLSILEVFADTNEPSLRFVFSENSVLRYRQTQFSYWNFGNGNWNAPVQITRDYEDEFGRPIAQVQDFDFGPIVGTDSTSYEYAPNTDCLRAIRQYTAGDNDPLTLYRETVHFYNKSVSTSAPGTVAFKMYPNPASDVLTLEGVESSVVQITDVQGKILYQQTARSDQERIPVQHLLPGTYLVSVVWQGNWVSQWLQVNR